MSEASLTIEDKEVGLVEQFCYLSDMLSCGRGAKRAATIRTATAWKKWREIVSLITHRHVLFSSIDSIYNACNGSVLLYGSEMWGMTKKITDQIQECDQSVLLRKHIIITYSRQPLT